MTGRKFTSKFKTKGVLEASKEAIDKHGKPEMINTDQGSQFASEIFTQTVLSNQIKLSMDGKGRAIDNVFIKPPMTEC